MTNTETPRTGAIHWHIGHNMPGYLPESDVSTTTTLAQAADMLVEDLRFAIDSLDESILEAFAWRHRECGPDCCITGDRCEDDDDHIPNLDLVRHECMLHSGINVYLGSCVYWVEICIDDCDMEEEI